MPVEITASGFGESVTNQSQISLDLIGVPVSGTEVLFAFVGMTDAGRPNFSSAEYGVTGFSTQPLELVVDHKGAGGNSFPAAFIVALKDPSATSGTLSINFDESVAAMNAIALVFSGLDSAFGNYGSQLGSVINPQLPDFRIEDTYVAASGNLVLDLCVTESSNHTLHLLSSGSDANKVGDFSIGTGKFSVVWQLASSGGPRVIERDNCGGPFAGASLTTVDFPAT